MLALAGIEHRRNRPDQPATLVGDVRHAKIAVLAQGDQAIGGQGLETVPFDRKAIQFLCHPKGAHHLADPGAPFQHLQLQHRQARLHR